MTNIIISAHIDYVDGMHGLTAKEHPPTLTVPSSGGHCDSIWALHHALISTPRVHVHVQLQTNPGDAAMY